MWTFFPALPPAPRSQFVLPSAWSGARGNLIPASMWGLNAVMSPASHPIPSHPRYPQVWPLEEEKMRGGGGLPFPAQARVNEVISFCDSQESDLN